MCVGAEATSPFHCVWRLSAASLFRLEFRFGGSVVRWFGGPVVRWSGAPFRFGVSRSLFRFAVFGSPFSVRRFRFAVWVRCCRFAVGVRRWSSPFEFPFGVGAASSNARYSSTVIRRRRSSELLIIRRAYARLECARDQRKRPKSMRYGRGARRWDCSLAEGRSTTEVSETLAFAPFRPTAERPAS